MQAPSNRAVGNVLLLLGNDHGGEKIAAHAAQFVAAVHAQQAILAGQRPDFARHVTNLVPLHVDGLNLLLEKASNHLAEHVVILVEDWPRSDV